MSAKAPNESDVQRPRKRSRLEAPPNGEVGSAAAAAPAPTPVRPDGDEPAALRRLLSSLIRSSGKSDEHVAAALNAMALVDQKEELNSERSRLTQPQHGRPGGARGAFAAAAAVMREEMRRVDAFLGGMAAVARGAPAGHVAASAGVEVSGDARRGGPLAGRLIPRQMTPGTLIARAVPDQPDNVDRSLGKIVFNHTLEEEMEKWALPEKDCCEECGQRKNVFPLGWEFPQKMSLKEMMDIYFLGKAPKGEKLAMGPLVNLYRSDFKNVPRGPNTFSDMRMMGSYIEEVGRARGLWKGKKPQADKNKRARGKAAPGSGRKWTEKEVDELYNGVKLRFLDDTDLKPIKKHNCNSRHLEKISYQTILREESTRRKEAKKNTAARGNDQKSESVSTVQSPK